MSENKNENYMDGIISLDKALKWFKKGPNFESPYRSAVSEDESFDIFPEDEYKNIKSWVRKGKPIASPQKYYSDANNLEADSCPTAWKYYRRHYSIGTFKKAQNGSEYSFSFLGYTKHRLVAMSKNDLEKKRTGWGSPPVTASGLERLGGDCDFNFNEKKYPLFVKFLCKGKGIPTIAEIELLAKCYGMHHTLLNFSLIQGVGGMQNFKGIGYDRLDCFMYFLNEYYKTPEADRKHTAIVIRAAEAHQPALMYYLNQFDNIYDYCAKIYFLPSEKEHRGYYTGMMNELINSHQLFVKNNLKWKYLITNNTALINALIESGKQPLGSHDRVVEYMCLAVHFWRAKETYFKLMDKVFETIKTQQ